MSIVAAQRAGFKSRGATLPQSPPQIDGAWTETQSGAIYRFDDNGSGGVTMRGDFGPVVVIAQGRYGAGAIGWTYTIDTGEMAGARVPCPLPARSRRPAKTTG